MAEPGDVEYQMLLSHGKDNDSKIDTGNCCTASGLLRLVPLLLHS
jgi:hypothetical protein